MSSIVYGVIFDNIFDAIQSCAGRPKHSVFIRLSGDDLPFHNLLFCSSGQ